VTSTGKRRSRREPRADLLVQSESSEVCREEIRTRSHYERAFGVGLSSGEKSDPIEFLKSL